MQAADLDLARAKATSPVMVEPEGNVHVDFSSDGISLDDVERQLIVAALQVTAWNRARAALLLGLSRETLRYRMEKYQLRPPA